MKWALSHAEATGCLAHYRLRLFEVEFNVGHGAGIKTRAVNALPRSSAITAGYTPMEDNLQVSSFEPKIETCSRIRLISSMAVPSDDARK